MIRFLIPQYIIVEVRKINDVTLKLNVSSTFTLVDNNEANININLNLAPPTVTTEGTVTGTVYDTHY